VFSKLFGRNKDKETVDMGPDVMGLRTGSAFELDDLRLRLMEPDLLVEKVARTQFVEAAGLVNLDSETTFYRFYTDDEAFIQVNLSGGVTESHIDDVTLWHYYDTKGISTDAAWNEQLKHKISQPTYEIEGYEYQRVWDDVSGSCPPVAMTEKTYDDDGETTTTDQFIMLYERIINEDLKELLLVSGEESVVDNRLERCLVLSTGFSLRQSDISIRG